MLPFGRRPCGFPAKAGFLKENEKDLDHVLDVNLKAPVFLAELFAEQMIKQQAGGAIINFSSVCGHRGMDGMSYDAAKCRRTFDYNLVVITASNRISPVLWFPRARTSSPTRLC